MELPLETNRTTAVIISDIHFTPATLELATASLRQAQFEAFRLKVPLIIAGDTLDTKAVIRAECANRLIEMLDQPLSPTYMLVGNHDLLNEKGTEHSLNFLKPYVTVVETPTHVADIGATLIPYIGNKEVLQTVLSQQAPGSLLIMHQGVMGADLGHYVQDKTSLPPEAYADFRVISGHYHKAQDIKCGRPRRGAVGLFSYVGNPYSLSFGEANDGPKGFRVLMSDGTLLSVPTNLRKHVVLELTAQQYRNGAARVEDPTDILWVKVRGPASELANLKKVGAYKLDLIPTDSTPTQIDTNKLTRGEILDKLIEVTSETDAQKQELRALWRNLLETS